MHFFQNYADKIYQLLIKLVGMELKGMVKTSNVPLIRLILWHKVVWATCGALAHFKSF